VPPDLEEHLVMDNYATHKTALIRAWLARRPRWHVHLTPTSSSWLNQFERFFARLTEKRIRRGIHRSVGELQTAINAFIKLHNADPKPFRWTKSASDILASIERFCRSHPDCRTTLANPSLKALLRYRYILAIHPRGRVIWNLRQTPPHAILRDVVCQRSEPELWLAPRFSCYSFEFCFHGWRFVSLYRRPISLCMEACCLRTIQRLLAASPCGRLSRPRSTISQSDRRQVIGLFSPPRLGKPYKLSLEPHGSPLFPWAPSIACRRYEPRKHLKMLAIARLEILPSPLRDKVGCFHHDRFRG
jgi:transposase